MSLRLWPARDTIASPTATAVQTPGGIDKAKLRARVRNESGRMTNVRPTPPRQCQIRHQGLKRGFPLQERQDVAADRRQAR